MFAHEKRKPVKSANPSRPAAYYAWTITTRILLFQVENAGSSILAVEIGSSADAGLVHKQATYPAPPLALRARCKRQPPAGWLSGEG